MKKINFINEVLSLKNTDIYSYLYNYNNIPSGWKDFFNKDNTIQVIKNISEKIKNIVENDKSINIYPSIENIFKAFYLTSFDKLKLVFLGQDPYHNEGSATGLCFEVGNNDNDKNKDKKIIKNPSLKNIEKEYGKELDFKYLANNGVLFLNTSLTVIESKPNSNKEIWKPFTKLLFNYINSKDSVIWILLGKDAVNSCKNITNKTHKKVISSHPSPLSAYKKMGEYPAFIGSGILDILKTL